MSNFFKNASGSIRNSHFIIPAYMVFVTMLFIGISLGIEDYSTSRLGYEMFPTQKANAWVVPIVALLPQVGQVGFMLVFMFDTRKRWSAAISGLLFVFDVTTDVWFKTNGMAMGLLGFIYGFGETIVLYTIGSEVTISVAFGMCIELFPDFWRSCGDFFGKLFEQFANEGGEQPKAATQFARPSAQPPPPDEPPDDDDDKPAKKPFPREAMNRAKTDEEKKAIFNRWKNGN